MKIQLLKCWVVLFVSAISLGLVQSHAFGQNCLISFTGAAGNVLTSYINEFPNYPNSDAFFHTFVQDSNEPLPTGTYKTWCVDEDTLIDAAYNTTPGTLYSGMLFPTCDTNLNNEIPPGHTATSYASPAAWQQVNYILNHKGTNYFWDIQLAILDLVGGSGGPTPGPPDYPPFNLANIQSLLNDASNNAASWVPQCGDVIGAVYVITNEAGATLTSPVQLLLLEIPYCCISFSNCPPNLSLGCNPASGSIPDIDLTSVSASSSCGNPVTITGSKSESTLGCTTYRFLTYTASDGYGNTATCIQTITWTVDTTAPTITSVPSGGSLGCNPATLPTDASVAAQVTAVDDCTLQSTNVTHLDSGTSCGMTRTFTITVTDGCGNTAVKTVTYTWTVDTTAPVVSVPPGGDLGCNPTTTLPTDASVTALVTATDDCTLKSTSVTHVDVVSPCGTTRTFTVTATDSCGNSTTKTAVYTWTIDTTAPTITSVPPNTNLGCNPATLPSDASVAALVKATDTCTLKSIAATHIDSGSPCGMTRTFTITATDACGNSATKTVIYTWTVDLTAPTITSVPANTNLGCNPITLPSDASLKALVKATDNCTLVSTNVSHLDSTNGCTVTRTFTINATDACGNVSANKTVIYTWTADTTPPVIICPPDITISNNVVPYCTFAPCDYSAKCDGINAASILTACFNKVYTGGYLQCGITNTSYWIKFTSCTNVQKFIQCGGTPNCLKGNYSNPTSCEAGSFAGQALCLKLNVDLGDYCKSVTGLSAGCGDLVLNDPSSPLNGKSIRQILGICNTALGGGNISSYGCTISSLNLICSNLNLSFENFKPSTWCQSHVVVPGITNVSPKVTGYAIVVDKCSSTPVLTYSDVTTAGTCVGAYSIARTWLAVDGCGNTNYCTQNITVGVPKATVCVTGPCDSKCGQTGTYTCCVTNTGSTCFSACKITCCGQTFTCPALSPGQGCSFKCNYTFQSGDVGTFTCKATASCTYSTSSSACTTSDTCSTNVAKK
jgi:hypothetical protein